MVVAEHDSIEGTSKPCGNGKMTYKVIGARYATRFEIVLWGARKVWNRLVGWARGTSE